MLVRLIQRIRDLGPVAQYFFERMSAPRDQTRIQRLSFQALHHQDSRSQSWEPTS